MIKNTNPWMCANCYSYFYSHLGVYYIDFMQRIILYCKFTGDDELQTNLDDSTPVTYKQEMEWIVRKNPSP